MLKPERESDDENESLKFTTSPNVRAYIDLLAKKKWHGTSRSSVIDYFVRQALNEMRLSSNPPVTDAEIEAELARKPKTQELVAAPGHDPGTSRLAGG